MSSATLKCPPSEFKTYKCRRGHTKTLEFPPPIIVSFPKGFHLTFWERTNDGGRNVDTGELCIDCMVEDLKERCGMVEVKKEE